MNKLDQYLHRVCRSMGGPKELREHVRQELREHLIDAASQHQAGGLSEDAALDKALQEFGQPELVRSELEATHGHRMLAVVIDQAMQWKEMTMKAKWLWTTWAYLAVVGIIALEVFFCFFQLIYIIPKIKYLRHGGFFTTNEVSAPPITWMLDFLSKVCNAAEWVTWWMILLILALWGLFEWRVKSENKSFIRLSILGSVALGLLVVVVIMAESLILLPILTMPSVGRMARGGAVESISLVDQWVKGVEQALPKNDWDTMLQQANQVSTAMKTFNEGPMLYSLFFRRKEPPYFEEMQDKWKVIQESFEQVQQAIQTKDVGRLGAALQAFRVAFDPFQELVKRPER